MPLFVTPTCPFCGKKGNVVLNEEQIQKHVAYSRGEIRFIQDAFPELSAPVREQIKTGIHPQCWDEAFSDMDDEEYEDDEELEDLGETNLTAQETLNAIFGTISIEGKYLPPNTDENPYKVIMDDIWNNSKD